LELDLILNLWLCHTQAANAGGVAVSGLEMAQNSARLSWSSEEVDGKLKVRLVRRLSIVIGPANAERGFQPQ